jgi:hypothetical protein
MSYEAELHNASGGAPDSVEAVLSVAKHRKLPDEPELLLI